MNKRVLLLVSSVVAVVMTLTGCGSSNQNNQQVNTTDDGNVRSAKEEEKVKVRLSYWNKEESVKSLLALVEEKLPNIDLEYQFIDNKQYEEVIKTQLAAGEGPDIIGGLINDNTVKLGYFEDLTERYADKYVETGTANYTFNGKLYGLPQGSWFNGMFYNIGLFEQYNLEVPTNLEEYYKVSEVFQQNGIKPQAIGLKNPLVVGQSFIALAINDYIGTEQGKSFNEQFKSGESKMADALLPALEKWKTYMDKGIFTKEMLGLEEEQAIDEFTSGKAAMFQSGPWYMETFKQKAPDMKIGMFPNVGTEGPVGWMVGGPGVSFGVNAESKAKEAVYQILDLLSSPEGQTAYWEDNKGISSYVKGVQFEMPAEYDGAQEAFKAGQIMYPPDGWGVGRDVSFAELGKQLQEVLIGGKDPKAALEAVDKKQADLLAKSK
ncbi:ABC transporter substrate-binding protein [Paenibacillus sp. GCM10023252]|uniref:ABC transporter substrate-binding protein n=1 Tax=Paenibacillus sp. GCM10023252 TaxID=3252649 RepID=UPI00361B3D12